jgi:hypothetical protein
MLKLQDKWIELDNLLQGITGSNTEMTEKKTVSDYLKSLGMKRVMPTVVQTKLSDRRVARIYVWKNTPIGNVGLLTGRSIAPSLHYLVLEDENYDNDEIDLQVVVSGNSFVSIPIPQTLDNRMAILSHSVQPKQKRKASYSQKPTVAKKAHKTTHKTVSKSYRKNPITYKEHINYGGQNTVPNDVQFHDLYPSVWELIVLNKFFPNIEVMEIVPISNTQQTAYLSSPVLENRDYGLTIDYTLNPNNKIGLGIDITIHQASTQTKLQSWHIVIDGKDYDTWKALYIALHSKVTPFFGEEIVKYISNPSAYKMPKQLRQVDLSHVRPVPRQQIIPTVRNLTDEDLEVEDIDSRDTERENQEEQIIEQEIQHRRTGVVERRVVSEPIDDVQDQSEQVRIKYDFEGLQEEPIIPITNDLLFTLDDFADVKWTTKIDYDNLWWIFAKNMTLQPICERLNKLFVPKVEDIGKAIISSEWCVKKVKSKLIAGKHEKVEMIFGLSANYTIQKTKLYGSVIKKTKPISEPQTIELAFGITSQSNGLRLRVGKCTNGKSLTGFSPQKAYRLTMPLNQFKGMHLTDVMVAFFNMVLVHILSNPNILAKIGEYCELPTRQTFTGVTKTVIQPTVGRATVQPRPVVQATQTVRDRLSSAIPNIQFIKSKSDVDHVPSLNKWYAGYLANDFPHLENHMEIILVAHNLTVTNQLKLTIKLLSDADYSIGNNDFFALLSSVEQDPKTTHISDQTTDRISEWADFLTKTFNFMGIAFQASINDDMDFEYMINLSPQSQQPVNETWAEKLRRLKDKEWKGIQQSVERSLKQQQRTTFMHSLDAFNYNDMALALKNHVENMHSAIALEVAVDEYNPFNGYNVRVVVMHITGHKKQPKLFILPLQYKRIAIKNWMQIGSVDWKKSLIAEPNNHVYLPLAYFDKSVSYDDMKAISDFLITLWTTNVGVWTKTWLKDSIANNPIILKLNISTQDFIKTLTKPSTLFDHEYPQDEMIQMYMDSIGEYLKTKPPMDFAKEKQKAYDLGYENGLNNKIIVSMIDDPKGNALVLPSYSDKQYQQLTTAYSQGLNKGMDDAQLGQTPQSQYDLNQLKKIVFDLGLKNGELEQNIQATTEPQFKLLFKRLNSQQDKLELLQSYDAGWEKGSKIVFSTYKSKEPQVFDDFWVITPPNMKDVIMISPKGFDITKAYTPKIYVSYQFHQGHNTITPLLKAMVMGENYQHGNLIVHNGNYFEQVHNGIKSSFIIDPLKIDDVVKKMAKLASVAVPNKYPKISMADAEKWIIDRAVFNVRNKNNKSHDQELHDFLHMIQKTLGYKAKEKLDDLYDDTVDIEHQKHSNATLAYLAQQLNASPPRFKSGDEITITDAGGAKHIAEIQMVGSYDTDLQGRKYDIVYMDSDKNGEFGHVYDPSPDYVLQLASEDKDWQALKAMIAKSQQKQERDTNELIDMLATPTTVEPPKGSTQGLGTVITNLEDFLNYPDATLFVTPDEDNDLEVRVIAKVENDLYGFDEDGYGTLVDLDSFEDAGDTFYQSIQVNPIEIEESYLNKKRAKELVQKAIANAGI